MSDCQRLSDRMPEVVMERASWTAEEAAHLADCDDCRAEYTTPILPSPILSASS